MTTVEWNTYEFDLSQAINQDVFLLLEVSRTWNPHKVMGTPDSRDLGVAIGSIQFHANEKME